MLYGEGISAAEGRNLFGRLCGVHIKICVLAAFSNTGNMASAFRQNNIFSGLFLCTISITDANAICCKCAQRFYPHFLRKSPR